MKTLNKIITATVLAVAATSASAAPIFVGAWNLYSGQDWRNSAPTLTAQMAAASLFGGAATDYVISTGGENVATINFSAWYDVYGVGPHLAAQDFMIDTGVIGVYDRSGDASAMIRDNAAGAGLMNYAFRVDAPANVPEPVSLGLLGLGLAGMALARRRRSPK